MSKKDSYWFKHDSTAGRALKMRKMAHIHKHWGKGIYWDVIEVLREQSGYTFDYDDTSLQMLSDLIGCKDDAKFITWMRDCVQIGLFEVAEDKFFSAILCENMEVWEKQKRNGSQPKAKPKPNGSIIEEESIEEKKTEQESIEERKASFIYQVSLFRNKYNDDMLQSFAEYWMEHNVGGKKMRFEMEKVFQIERRLLTWNKNQSKFKQNGQSKPTANDFTEEWRKQTNTASFD